MGKFHNGRRAVMSVLALVPGNSATLDTSTLHVPRNLVAQNSTLQMCTAQCQNHGMPDVVATAHNGQTQRSAYWHQDPRAPTTGTPRHRATQTSCFNQMSCHAVRCALRQSSVCITTVTVANRGGGTIASPETVKSAHLRANKGERSV